MIKHQKLRWLKSGILIIGVVAAPFAASWAQSPDAELARWLGPQDWKRDTAEPVVALGPAGAFDDQHIFAPCVARENGQFWLWYCGSQGTVEDRVFKLGLMTGVDGRTFARHPDSPVMTLADGRHSILTPTLLSNNDGTPVREEGKLRLWFSSTDFHDRTGLHTLHETTSGDGIVWSDPSPVLLRGVYAPTILKDGDTYRLWFTDVSQSPWLIRYAESRDGRSWNVEREAVLKVDQPWELSRLFYPTVRKVDGVLLMWYGSYWKGQDAQKTALGFAVSRDGRHWTKSPHNPVLRPDTARTFESHYVTSQSVIRLTDGSWRIWYASRTRPPFVHKYFAIGTASWSGPSP